MIDYEKLEKAMKLCQARSRENGGEVCNLTLGFASGELTYWLCDSIQGFERDYDSLDELIAKLEELVKPEPKYKVGQKIWVQSHKSDCENVLAMHAFEGTVIPCLPCDYGLSEPYVRVIAENDQYSGPESFCFPSRQALIQSQLQYWQKLYNEQLDDHGIPKFEGEVKGLGFDATKKSIATLDMHDEYVFRAKCEHDKDICRFDFRMSFKNEVAGNRYYINNETNEVHCQCGVVADFPHRCRCIKCGEFYK